MASIKSQGIEHIVIAHGEGSLADGTWRMDGNSQANLETVGKHFANKHEKVLVIACEHNLTRTGDGTNGYVFAKGKSQPTELDLSNKVENKNGVKLQQEQLLKTEEAKFVVENFESKDDTEVALDAISKERLPEVLKTDPQLLGILQGKYPELANKWIQNNSEAIAQWIINASPEDVNKHWLSLPQETRNKVNAGFKQITNKTNSKTIESMRDKVEKAVFNAKKQTQYY